MKKLTLFLVATLFSALSFAAALNPFAYGLSSSLSIDQTTLTVKYSLNATATSVNVVILNGETVVKTVDCSVLGLTKGSYTTTIPTDEFPKTTSLTWKVEVKGAEVISSVESGSKKFYRPFSVAVDNNPENPYFGRILCGETYTPSATKYVSYGVGSGIYEFDPSFDLVPNGTKSGYNGGKTFTNSDHSPFRIRISKDGRIFVTAQDFAGDFLWELNPSNLNEWKSIFQGATHNADKLLDASGKFIAGTNAGFDVRGEGENLQLLMLSCNKLGTDVATCQCHEYNLGTAIRWSTTPSRKIIDGSAINNLLCARYSQVQYDKDGGFWATYYVNASTSGIVHFTKEGVKDYEKHGIAVRAAGLCFNRDYSKVIIAGNDIFGTLKETAKAVVYNVSKDADGKPVLTKETVVNMSSVGGNINDLAWDYADNIYAVGNNGEWLCAYPLPHAADKVVSTPCASKYAFELQESVGTIYTVTATASPAEAGTVVGAGEYAQDTEVTLTATANTGYRFENWTVGSNTETANPLTFTITENITATANFVALTPYTINATANDANMGTVTGGGTYYEGETVTLTATPKTGYRFVNWSNSSTDAKLTFTASENLDLTANFEICTYTLTSFSNDETKGTVSGAGTYNYGATATLTATPTDGYKLLYWSDRSTENPRTITMAKNEAISAYFVKIYDEEPTFTITKVWENLDAPASTNNGYQAVGWDGKIYLKDRGNDVINVYSDATTSATYASTDSKDDQSIAVDDAGNLVLRSGSTYFYDAPKQVILYKKGETTYKTIDFTLPASGRCDFISASGDLFSAKGGYVYFYCQNQTTVSRLHVKNGGATAGDIVIDAVGAGITGGNSQSHVMVDIFGNLVTHSRTEAINKTINAYTGEATTFTLPNDQKAIALGGCSFELGGKEFWAYNVKGSNICNTEWNLYNMTDKKYLSNEILYVENNTDKNSAANWLNVQVVDENTAYIYQFCPTVAMAVWKVKMLSGPTLYTVTTTAENGTITGNAGTYEEGAEVTLTATPNRGYRFLNWTKGGDIVSTLPTYTFTITENIELVANFEALTPYTITVETSNAEQGSVTGGGTYYEGEEVTIKATAAGGFVFEKWSDDNTDNPRTITVSEAATYTAIFKLAPARVFAYNLDVVDNGNDTYTLSFIPNANATSGRVILYNDDTKEQIHEAPIAGTIAKGVKSEVVVSKSVMPTSGTVTWAVELTGEPVEALTLLSDPTKKGIYGFNRPQGVAIDNNPASDYFGRMYIALPKAGGTGYSDTNYGIVVMDPQHNRLKSGVVANGDALGANGRYSMHRIAVNPTNGNVYYVRTSDSGEGVTGTAIYELTPDATNILTDGGTAKNVINGIGDITNANSVCFDETGAMYVMANANYTNAEGSTGRVYKVIDGVATLFTPSSIEIASKDNAIVPDGKGGFWVAQHRNSLDGSNHLFHINTSGATDYYIDQNNNASLLPIQTYTKSGTTYKNASYRGQVAYYSIDENNGLVAYGGGAKVSVFKATYDGSGVPTLTTWQTISLLQQSTTEGINVDGIAFDYAGNIIVMSATDERMYQYALPIETANTSLVPSPTSKAIKLGTIYTVEVAVNDPAMGSATGAGAYVAGETATLEASPAAHHKFVNWTYGSETSTTNPLELVVDGDITVTANFEPVQYTLIAPTNDENKGTVSGAGAYNYGTEVTLIATPKEGHKLLYWSDRSTENPRTITMTKNEAISAYFVKEYTEEPTFKIEKMWENTNVPASTTNGYQAVGWDGKIYMQNRTAGKIITYSSAEDTGTEYATSGLGQQIAVDEAGNLIVFNATFSTANPNAILIYQKGTTEGKAVSFTLKDPAACHFFSASGDIYSAEGGYVYFYCAGKTVINRLKITNGAETTFDVTTDVVGESVYSSPQNTNYVMVDIFGNLVAHARSNKVNVINVHTNESKAFTLPNIKMGTLGGCSFELGGKELWAYHAGASNYSSEWNIYNMTDSKFLSDDDFYAVDKSATTNYACNWLNVQVVDEYTAYIYQFCPLKAAAVWKVSIQRDDLQEYTITATANDASMGSVTGSGTYYEGATATLIATPNTGYRFVNWTKAGVEVSTNATYTFTITEDVELVANFEALPEIVYELNGGVWNKYGWTSKKDMYNALLDDWRAYSGSTRTNVSYDAQLGVGNSSKGIPTTITSVDDRVALMELFTDARYATKWGWLATYVDFVATTQYKKMDEAQGMKTQPTSGAGVLTYTLGNFFGEDKAHTTDYIDAVDFTGEEAHITAFAPYWGQTFPLPTQPTEEVVLNAPYKEGYLFEGWYATSNFSGEEVTVVDENTNGTLYAKWLEHFYTRNVTNGDFGTICLPYGSSSMTGAEFYEVVGKETGKVYLDQVTKLEAGIPYIFRATANTIKVIYEGNEELFAGNDNGLYGTFNDNTTVEEGNYIVFNNELRLCGTGCYINAYRAYLKLNEVSSGVPAPMPGRQRIGMNVQGGNETTALDNITEGNGTITPTMEGTYDVLGRKLTQPTNTGVYIINGKKVFVVK